jgi:plasmid stabilization system protein ParE
VTKHRLVLRPAAQSDIDAAAEWYARERLDLGLDFASEIVLCFARVVEAPESFQIVHRDLRRAFVRRFPYCVFFRVETDELIVVAVTHGARRPATWKRRR